MEDLSETFAFMRPGQPAKSGAELNNSLVRLDAAIQAEAPVVEQQIALLMLAHVKAFRRLLDELAVSSGRRIGPKQFKRLVAAASMEFDAKLSRYADPNVSGRRLTAAGETIAAVGEVTDWTHRFISERNGLFYWEDETGIEHDKTYQTRGEARQDLLRYATWLRQEGAPAFEDARDGSGSSDS